MIADTVKAVLRAEALAFTQRPRELPVYDEYNVVVYHVVGYHITAETDRIRERVYHYRKAHGY